tara:strand:- start:285 stop:521 length:237 start_codon:yes stop_codon:yes gene_type:complete
MFEINKDIPMPERNTPRNNKYNFHKMGIGDSIDMLYDFEEAQRLRVAASNYGTRNSKKFTSRKVSEDDKTLLRLWRIA